MSDIDDRLDRGGAAVRRMAATVPVTAVDRGTYARSSWRRAGLIGLMSVTVAAAIALPLVFLNPGPLRSTPGASTPSIDPEWLTVEADDLAAIAQQPTGSEARMPLRTETILCWYANGTGGWATASNFPLNEDLTFEAIATTCSTPPDGADPLTQPPDTFTLCRGEFSDTDYENYTAGNDILAGESTGSHPGFPVMLGWNSDCVSEHLGTAPEWIQLDPTLTLDAVNHARTLEMAVRGAAYRNCIGYRQSVLLADSLRQQLGSGWLFVSLLGVNLDTEDDTACFQLWIDPQWGTIFIDRLNQTWASDEQPGAETTIPPIAPLFAVRVTCTVELDGYPCSALIDGNPTTTWQVPDGGIGVTITFMFAEPVQITDLVFENEPGDAFIRNARVRGVEVSIDDFTQTIVTELSDTNDAPERIDIRSLRTSVVTIEITSAYPGQSFNDLALSEITIWGRLAPVEPVTTTTVVSGGEVTPVTVPEDDRLLVLGTIDLEPIPDVVACSGFAGGVPVEGRPNQGGSVTLPVFASPIAALRGFLNGHPGDPLLATSGYWAIPQTDGSIVFGKPLSDADIGLGFVTLITVVPSDESWTVASWQASGC